jgi:hypothetical protein
MRRLLNELPSIWSIHLDLRILQPTVNGSQDQAVSNWQPRFSAKSQIRLGNLIPQPPSLDKRSKLPSPNRYITPTTLSPPGAVMIGAVT